MYPQIFKYPFIDRHQSTFGVLVVLGFLLGTFVFYRLAERHAHDPEREMPGYSALPTWILIGIIAGARLMYVVVEVFQGTDVGQAILAEPWRVIAIWEGGLVMYGGTFGAIVAGLWCARRYRLRRWHALDIGTIAAFVGLGVGRIGCLMVGDDYGQVVPEGLAGLPFPLVLRVPDPLPEGSLFGAENAGQVLWATQIWMSVDAFVLAFIGYRVFLRRRFEGQAALWIFLLYAIMRSIIEGFRGDSVRGLWFGGAISTSQLISIGFGTAAALLLWRCRRRVDPPLPGTTAASRAAESAG